MGTHGAAPLLILTDNPSRLFPGASEFSHTRTCRTGSPETVAKSTHGKKVQGRVMGVTASAQALRYEPDIEPVGAIVERHQSQASDPCIPAPPEKERAARHGDRVHADRSLACLCRHSGIFCRWSEGHLNPRSVARRSPSAPPILRRPHRASTPHPRAHPRNGERAALPRRASRCAPPAAPVQRSRRMDVNPR